MEPNHPSSKGVFARLLEALFGSGTPEPPPSALQRYHKAVEIAWADKQLSEAELSWLTLLEREFGLSQDEAEDVEREVFGSTKEEVAARRQAEEELALRADVMNQYKVAVAAVWADKKLNEAESDHLSALEDELALGRDEADEIEREIMGGIREEVVSTDPEAILTPSPELPDDERWADLAEECVEVVDELDRNMGRFDDAKRQELADHVIWRLAEVLERSGVDPIFDDTAFDSKRHKPDKAISRTASGTTILETLSPGFAVGHRVLRRARVRVE